MNRTGIFYTDPMGKRWEVDDIVPATTIEESFAAIRCADGVPVVFPIRSVEVDPI